MALSVIWLLQTMDGCLSSKWQSLPKLPEFAVSALTSKIMVILNRCGGAAIGVWWSHNSYDALLFHFLSAILRRNQVLMFSPFMTLLKNVDFSSDSSSLASFLLLCRVSLLCLQNRRLMNFLVCRHILHSLPVTPISLLGWWRLSEKLFLFNWSMCDLKSYLLFE